MVEGAVVGEYQVRARTDFDARGRDLKPLRGEAVGLGEEGYGVNDHAVAEHAGLARMDDAGGDEVQRVRLVADFDGVAGVVTALVARDHVEALGQEVNDLALALVAPLRADDYDDHSFQFSVFSFQRLVSSRRGGACARRFSEN